MTGKYYRADYDRRRREYFCEVYDENLNTVEIKRGIYHIEGLTEIAWQTDPVTAFHECKPLNDEFVILGDFYKLTNKQREKFIKNVIKKPSRTR